MTTAHSVCFVSHRWNKRDLAKEWPSLCANVAAVPNRVRKLRNRLTVNRSRAAVERKNAMERSLHHLNVHRGTSFLSHPLPVSVCVHVFALSSSGNLLSLCVERCLIWLPICPVFIKVRPSHQPTEYTTLCTPSLMSLLLGSGWYRSVNIFLLSMRNSQQQFSLICTAAVLMCCCHV